MNLWHIGLFLSQRIVRWRQFAPHTTTFVPLNLHPLPYCCCRCCYTQETRPNIIPIIESIQAVSRQGLGLGLRWQHLRLPRDKASSSLCGRALSRSMWLTPLFLNLRIQFCGILERDEEEKHFPFGWFFLFFKCCLSLHKRTKNNILFPPNFSR